MNKNIGTNLLALIVLLAGWYWQQPVVLSVGLFATLSDDTDVEEHTFGVAAKYFITPVVSGELDYTMKDKDSAIGIRLAARF